MNDKHPTCNKNDERMEGLRRLYEERGFVMSMYCSGEKDHSYSNPTLLAKDYRGVVVGPDKMHAIEKMIVDFTINELGVGYFSTEVVRNYKKITQVNDSIIMLKFSHPIDDIDIG